MHDSKDTLHLGGVVVLIASELDLQLTVQSVPISTKVVSLNPAHGKVVLDTTSCDKSLSMTCVAGRWFSPGTTDSSTNKTDCHDNLILQKYC